MSRAIDREGWVAMEIPAQGEISYEIGELKELAKTRSPSRQSLFRVLRRSERLTPTVIGALAEAADGFLGRHFNMTTPRQVARQWNEQANRVMYFIYDNDGLVPLDPLAQSGGVRKKSNFFLSSLEQSRFGATDPGVFIELFKSDADPSYYDVWADLRSALDASLAAGAKLPAAHAPKIVDLGVLPEEARRVRLLHSGWPTSKTVAAQARSRSRNSGQWAKDKRTAGQLLGVWSAQERTYRHPDFQFELDGSLRGEVKELLSAMAKNPAWRPEADANGWRRAYWLYQPLRSLSEAAIKFASEQANTDADNNPLSGSAEQASGYIARWLEQASGPETEARTPAEVFAAHPDAVIALAREATSTPSDKEAGGVATGEL